jgi:hypothetical protein
VGNAATGVQRYGAMWGAMTRLSGYGNPGHADAGRRRCDCAGCNCAGTGANQLHVEAIWMASGARAALVQPYSDQASIVLSSVLPANALARCWRVCS